ncbi:hypothetical protein [Eoetvoesiella caeni]
MRNNPFGFLKRIIIEAFIALVVIPGTLAMALTLIFASIGLVSIHSIVEAIYVGAVESVVPAPAGHIMRRNCVEEPNSNALKPVLCTSHELVAIPIPEAIMRDAAVLRSIVWQIYGTFAFFGLAFGASRGISYFFANRRKHRNLSGLPI